jgi:hypothetical protein
MSKAPVNPSTHTRELRKALQFLGVFWLCLGSTYVVPGLAEYRPWILGERVPLVGIVEQDGAIVEVGAGVGLQADAAPMGGDTGTPVPSETHLDPEEIAELPEPAPVPVAPAPRPNAPKPAKVEMLEPEAQDGLASLEVVPSPRPRGGMRRPGEGRLADRKPAHGTPLEVPPGALDHWFQRLARAEAGEAGVIARALHFGDSTIAADGLTKTMRGRLQGRFGDGGPGFVAVHADPRWSARPSILRTAKGSWRTRTITHGGAGNAHYGLGGMVSTASGPSSSLLGGEARGEAKQRQLLHRVDLYYQIRTDGGSLSLQPGGGAAVDLSTRGESLADGFKELRFSEGIREVLLGTGADGPVTVYGVVLETAGPGVTWETLGVAGAGQGSMMRQGKNHLSGQIGRRDPDLLVYQMGGNELGYPSLKSGSGTVWLDRYKTIIARLRAGAPEASCLLITPLDQGERVRGSIRSKPSLDLMIRLQRQTAEEVGCAFWDARAAMGGPGSFGAWLGHKPALAWADLYHLTGKGLHLVGNTLADAMEAAYEEYRGRG